MNAKTGEHFLALFNLSDEEREVAQQMDSLTDFLQEETSEKDPCGIDFWTGERIPCAEGVIRKTLAPHGCVVFRII